MLPSAVEIFGGRRETMNTRKMYQWTLRDWYSYYKKEYQLAGSPKWAITPNQLEKQNTERYGSLLGFGHERGSIHNALDKLWGRILR